MFTSNRTRKRVTAFSSGACLMLVTPTQAFLPEAATEQSSGHVAWSLFIFFSISTHCVNLDDCSCLMDVKEEMDVNSGESQDIFNSQRGTKRVPVLNYLTSFINTLLFPFTRSSPLWKLLSAYTPLLTLMLPEVWKDISTCSISCVSTQITLYCPSSF